MNYFAYFYHEYLSIHNEYIDIDDENRCDLIKKYYLMAIEYGNNYSMNNLEYYYYEIEKNYELMKKYYLMAIEKNNTNAMINFGIYYKTIEKNYDLMKKYYLIAIEQNDCNAMNVLAQYYEDNDHYDLMKKYYLMAIENGNGSSMNNLGHYYETIECNQELMLKYYLMAVEHDNLHAMCNLKDNTTKIKLYRLLTNIIHKNRLIKQKIKDLEEEKQIRIYKTKISLFKRLNNCKTCTVCLSENALNIYLNCGHEICIDCYEHDIKCYFNWCN